MCALIHFELAGISGPMLLAEPLHLFALCAGEARHTNDTAKQHGAQVILNWQVCVPEETGEESAKEILKTPPCNLSALMLSTKS